MSGYTGKGSTVRGYYAGYNAQRRRRRMLARKEREKRERIAYPPMPDVDLSQYPERLTREQALELNGRYPFPLDPPEEVKERIRASMPWEPVVAKDPRTGKPYGSGELHIAKGWFPMTRQEEHDWLNAWSREQKVEYLRGKGIEDPESHWSVNGATRR